MKYVGVVKRGMTVRTLNISSTCNFVLKIGCLKFKAFVFCTSVANRVRISLFQNLNGLFFEKQLFMVKM